MPNIAHSTGTTIPPETTPRLTYADWIAEGQLRFGKNFEDWRFKCPICGNVATVSDFRLFKDKGATPDTATKECLGRYNGSKFKAFGSSAKDRGAPCDYAVWGLFSFPGVIVDMPDGKTIRAFAFGDPA